MQFDYSPAKNQFLLEERGIGFEEIILEIQTGNMLGIADHHNQEKYPHQKIIIIRVLDVVYMVPFVKQDDGTLFLKTLYPSRKATKKYNKIEDNL